MTGCFRAPSGWSATLPYSRYVGVALHPPESSCRSRSTSTTVRPASRRAAEVSGSHNYCVKDLVHSELRDRNDGYHDRRNIFEQGRRQVFPESLGQAPADSRTTQRADNGAERAREQSTGQ
jgi:hypothetical protein